MRGSKETAIRRTVSDPHELWAELEAVRREITTIQHRIEVAKTSNPDLVAAATARLEQAEATERDLLRQLAEPEQLDTNPLRGAV